MADQTGPLGAEDLKSIRANLAALDDADKEIDRAIRAGIDMSEQKKTVAEQRAQLMQIGRAYFPGQTLR